MSNVYSETCSVLNKLKSGEESRKILVSRMRKIVRMIKTHHKSACIRLQKSVLRVIDSWKHSEKERTDVCST